MTQLQVVKTLPFSFCMNYVAISPDGKKMVCVGDCNTAYILAIRPGCTYPPCSFPSLSAFSPFSPFQDSSSLRASFLILASPSSLLLSSSFPSFFPSARRSFDEHARYEIITQVMLGSNLNEACCFSCDWNAASDQFAILQQDPGLVGTLR